MAYGEEAKGPVAALMTEGNPSGNGAAHRVAAETGEKPEESAISELHGLLANISVALVVAHIFGVALASFGIAKISFSR